MKITSALRASIGALALAAAAQASAGPVLLVTNGILTGAKNVSVQGTLYDVTFVDGTCAALFGGCDAASDFAFTTSSSATAAALALLNQVFVNGSQGQFDNRPQNTFGCASDSICRSLIPFLAGTNGSNGYSAVATNFVQQNGDGASTLGHLASFNSANFIDYNYARFQLSTAPAQTAVPEPTSIALVGLGLAGLAFTRRRKS